MARLPEAENRPQLSLFAAEKPSPSYPEGFAFQENIISPEDEATLLGRFSCLPFKEFQYQGFEGKRRVVSFGWRYDFNDRKLYQADELPGFLIPIRVAAASFAGMPAEKFVQALITEYTPGAGIGWHRDRPQFGEVIGISLRAGCTFRLRRKQGEKWLRTSLQAPPRSAYLLSDLARSEWEHSIPPVQDLRYSITFRNLRKEGD